MDKSTPRSIKSCYQNKNPSQMFRWGQSFGDNLIYKSFKKLSLVELLLNLNTGSGLVNNLNIYYTQSQMFSKERYEASFEIAVTKTSENIQQNVCS